MEFINHGLLKEPHMQLGGSGKPAVGFSSEHKNKQRISEKAAISIQFPEE